MTARKYNNAAFVLLFVCFSYSLCFGNNNEKLVEEILRGYAESTQRLRSVSYSYSLEKFTEGQFREVTVGRVVTDQRNAKHFFEQNRGEGGQRSQHEDIVAPEWNNSIRISRNDQGEPIVFSYHNSESITDISKVLGPMNFLFGKFFFVGYVHFPDVLRGLNSNDVSVIDNINQKEVRFVYRDYRYRILLGSDTFTLKLFEKNTLKQKPDAYETVSYLFEVLETQEVNGLFFPVVFVITHSMAGGTIEEDDISVPIPAEKTMYRYSLRDISFNELSEKDFRISIAMPNGTPAYMRDAPQIQYIWFDGKIVPKTDELMLRIARGNHRFIPGPSEPRFWMMGIGIALIVFALSVKAYKMYKGINA